MTEVLHLLNNHMPSFPKAHENLLNEKMAFMTVMKKKVKCYITLFYSNGTESSKCSGEDFATEKN